MTLTMQILYELVVGSFHTVTSVVRHGYHFTSCLVVASWFTAPPMLRGFDDLAFSHASDAYENGGQQESG